jgi:hypothetical protein
MRRVLITHNLLADQVNRNSERLACSRSKASNLCSRARTSRRPSCYRHIRIDLKYADVPSAVVARQGTADSGRLWPGRNSKGSTLWYMIVVLIPVGLG